MRKALLLSFVAVLIACSQQEKKDETSSAESNATEASPQNGGDEGSVCWETSECARGLVCKARPSGGPPPGAVGMPIPSGGTHSGPPPGAVGMPLPPNTCQTPAPGEAGSECISDSECDDGLVCEHDDDSATSSTGGPPPGAVGLPIPADETRGRPSTAPTAPPGAVGLPIPNYGRCAESGGPPPGALGLPIFP